MTTNPTPNRHEVGKFGHSFNLANIEETKNVQYGIVDIPSKKPSYGRVVRKFDLINASKNKKYIPHKVARKDLIEKNSNIFVPNGEAKININCHQNTSASSCQLSSNTESSLKQSDGSSSNFGQVQWAGRNYYLKFIFGFP